MITVVLGWDSPVSNSLHSLWSSLPHVQCCTDRHRNTADCHTLHYRVCIEGEREGEGEGEGGREREREGGQGREREREGEREGRGGRGRGREREGRGGRGEGYSHVQNVASVHV